MHLLVLRTNFFLSDISLIYHVIRGQGTIKLYVVYNVLEVSGISKMTDFLFGQVFKKPSIGYENCNALNIIDHQL